MCFCSFTWAILHEGGETNTGAALRITRQLVFNEQNGDRPNAANIAVLVTDGNENRGFDAQTEAANLRNSGVTIFTVGITPPVDVEQLRGIATDPDETHVFTVDGKDPIRAP